MSDPARPHSLPPLDWLRIFEAAGRLGSFTAAAGESGTTQAAVSQRIRNLENHLGRELFVRSARGVTLTVDGESYLPLVHQALTALRQGTDDLFSTAPRELRIAALDSHISGILLPRTASFLAQRPGLRLITDSVPKRSRFDEEKTALQIRFGRGSWPGRVCRLLHSEELQPMAAGGFEEEWRSLPVIMVRGERPGWEDWAAHSGAAAPGPPVLSFDTMGHGLSAATSGQGVVLGSTVLGAHLLASGALKPVSEQKFQTGQGYWLTWPESFAASPKRREICDALTDALRSAC